MGNGVHPDGKVCSKWLLLENSGILAIEKLLFIRPAAGFGMRG
jgi:hypothetical protein